MRGRIVAGVGAWLLGATAATGGSLLAVSLIGKGMTGFPAQRAAVAATFGVTAGTQAPAASVTSPTAAARPVLPSASLSAHPRPARSPVPPRPQATSPATPPPSDGTVLTSSGGYVVASCPAGGAYLMSWSPQQGYAVRSVDRGPSAAAHVTFASDFDVVTMTITCPGGGPAATTQTWRRDE